jgi:hypothetical protein
MRFFHRRVGFLRALHHGAHFVVSDDLPNVSLGAKHSSTHQKPIGVMLAGDRRLRGPGHSGPLWVLSPIVQLAERSPAGVLLGPSSGVAAVEVSYGGRDTR